MVNEQTKYVDEVFAAVERKVVNPNELVRGFDTLILGEKISEFCYIMHVAGASPEEAGDILIESLTRARKMADDAIMANTNFPSE